MRGVVVFISGLFIAAALTMFSGVILEPILSVVVDNEAVQTAGYASDAESITDTINRWMPLFFIAYLLAWAGMWYFRQERMTAPRRGRP